MLGPLGFNRAPYHLRCRHPGSPRPPRTRPGSTRSRARRRQAHRPQSRRQPMQYVQVKPNAHLPRELVPHILHVREEWDLSLSLIAQCLRRRSTPLYSTRPEKPVGTCARSSGSGFVSQTRTCVDHLVLGQQRYDFAAPCGCREVAHRGACLAAWRARRAEYLAEGGRAEAGRQGRV